MSNQVVVMGNCHAQYLAAALTFFFPDLDVRMVGNPFDGPIHFRGVQPKYISSADAVAGLRDGDDKKLVIRQTTTMAGTKFEDRLTSLGVNYDIILFPYIEFRTLILKKTDHNFGPGMIRARMRGDEISGKVCLLKANIDESVYHEFIEEVRRRPAAYTHNHFDGEFFRKILSHANFDPLAQVVGRKMLADFFEEMGRNVGIPHQNSGFPAPQIVEQMQLKWPGSVSAEATKKAKMPYDMFSDIDWSVPAENVYVDYTTWRMLINDAKITGSNSSIIKCLCMYRGERRYVVWCRNLADWFLSKNKPGISALVVANRMIWDDTRGLLLQWVLDNLVIIRSSSLARNVFRKAALQAPGSNARVVHELIEAIG